MNIAFTLTPMSAPGSAALLTLFRFSDTIAVALHGGFGFHPRQTPRVCVNVAVYFKAISPMTRFHRFLVSLHIHDTTYSLSDFSLSPVFTAEDFGITALLRDRLLARSLLRLLIIIRPDTLTFLTGEWIGVFFGAFCALLLCWFS